MARRSKNRWRGWRVSQSGTEINRAKQRDCVRCSRPFSPRKASSRAKVCPSCRRKAEFERKVRNQSKPRKR